MRIVLLRGLCVWFVIILTEFIHGTLRTIFLEPLLGDFTARQVSVFTGSLLILIIAAVFSEWVGANNFRELFSIGLLWLVLTLSFEVILGKFIFGLSWERIFSDYNIIRGGLLAIGMLVLAASPLIAVKLRSIICRLRN